MSHKINKIWNKISYETIIFGVIMIRFLSTRALDLNTWATAWDAMDYSMGNGSRLLIGSIYRLFYGEYLDITVAYKYVGIGIMLTILVLAVVLGQLIRRSLAADYAHKDVIYGVVTAYVIAPFSIAYVWNEDNLGRFDVYMLLVALLTVLAALCIKNYVAKAILITVLGVTGLAIHQGYAFLYYPLTFTVLCYDAFAENRLHKKRFVGVVISGAIEVAAAIYFQFFTKINFDSVEETVSFIKSRTNMEVSDFAIQLEYFGSMKYQLDEVTSVFFHGNEDPIRHLLLILLLMSPLLILYLMVWKDVFFDLRQKKVKLIQSPYLYAALVNICFIPMFVIHVDWGRHLAPLMAMPTFVFLFLLAQKDKSIIYAFGKMQERVKSHPWYFVLTLVWIAGFDSFGARNFQWQTDRLYNFLKYGFHM